MPIGPWEDWSSAIDALMEQGYTREEAERIAGALEQEGKLDDGDAEGLWQSIKEGAVSIFEDLDLGTFSWVDEPAQRSSFVMMKSENSDYTFKSVSPILREQKEDEDDWETIYGAVMVPNETDKDGDIIPAHVIKAAAHEFLEEGKVNDIDSDHDLITGDGTLVESWLLKEEKEYELPDGGTEKYPANTWMVGVQPTKEIKEKIEAGEYSGFSVAGDAEKIKLSKSVSECPSCGEELVVEDGDGEGKRFNRLNPLKSDDTMTEKDSQDESTDEEKEVTLKDIAETLEIIRDEVKTEDSEEKESDTQEKDEDNEDKQEIEDLGDALDWVSENAPTEVADMIVDAVRGESEEEEVEEENDEDEDDEEEKDEETESDEKESEDSEESEDTSEKTAKSKGADEESTRKAQVEDTSKSGIDYASRLEDRYKS